MGNPVAARSGAYAFYVEVPRGFSPSVLTLSIRSEGGFEGLARQVCITGLYSPISSGPR